MHDRRRISVCYSPFDIRIYNYERKKMFIVLSDIWSGNSVVHRKMSFDLVLDDSEDEMHVSFAISDL